MSFHYTTYQSPVGLLHLMAKDNKLRGLYFDKNWNQVQTKFKDSLILESNEALRLTIKELKSYFKGELQKFSVPVKFEGTEFQIHTWKTLSTIPFGKTINYSEQAHRMGKPQAVRAVGTTNGRNPISIIVPCHRVIGKSGSLTGYAGGLSVKEALLKLEGIL